MDIIAPLLLIVAGILAISGLIVAKKPDAKQLIDKLMPYQAFIGISLLIFGLWNLIRSLSSIFTVIRAVPLLGFAALGVIVCSVLLGFMFGMPQIAKWMPGAEQKGLELSRKLAPFQVVLGLLGIACSLVWLLYRFSILSL
jgi:hypothetical protein